MGEDKKTKTKTLRGDAEAVKDFKRTVNAVHDGDLYRNMFIETNEMIIERTRELKKTMPKELKEKWRIN